MTRLWVHWQPDAATTNRMREALVIVRGTFETHRALCLPEPFAPSVWSGLLFQEREGGLGFRFAGRDLMNAMIGAVCPAVGVGQTGDRVRLLACGDRKTTLFGRSIWITTSTEAVACQLVNAFEERLLDQPRQALRARYGREPGPLRQTPLDPLVEQFPAAHWPLSLPDEAPPTDAVVAAWYGFTSSLGDFAAVVGLDEQELVSRLQSAGVDRHARIAVLSRPSTLARNDPGLLVRNGPPVGGHVDSRAWECEPRSC